MSNVPAIQNEIWTCIKAKVEDNQLVPFKNPLRMASLAMKAITKNPPLMACTKESLASAVMEAFTRGLEIDTDGQAYLVPYGREAKFMLGYKGMIELARRSGNVDHIYAECVYENDEFEYSLGLYPDMKHKPAVSNRGKMIGVYAVAKMRGSGPVFQYLTVDEVNRVREASRSKNGPWAMWYEAMAKKTAIRRLCKLLPMNIEYREAVAESEEVEYTVIDEPQSQSLADRFNAPLPPQPAQAPQEEKQKRHRRTKAEMAEARAQEEAKKTAAPQAAPEPEPEPPLNTQEILDDDGFYDEPPAQAAPQQTAQPQRPMTDNLDVEEAFEAMVSKAKVDFGTANKVVDMLSRAKNWPIPQTKMFLVEHPSDFLGATQMV